MLQRIQSVFLFIAAVLIALTAVFPIASGLFQPSGLAVKMLSTKIIAHEGVTETLHLPVVGLMVWMILSVVLLLIAIFLFKKRRVQIAVSSISLICIILFYITGFVYFHSITHAYGTFQIDWASSIGLFFPLISFIFILFSIRRIKKDEKLVRSLDRIR